MFGAGCVELGVVLKFEQKLQFAAYPEFFIQSSPSCDTHGFGSARMTAAAVRPIQRPEPLGWRALLQQQLPSAIEDQQRKRPVQNPPTRVTLGLAQVAQPAVGFVYQDQSVRICHNTAINTNFVPDFIHDKYPSFGAPRW